MHTHTHIDTDTDTHIHVYQGGAQSVNYNRLGASKMEEEWERREEALC